MGKFIDKNCWQFFVLLVFWAMASLSEEVLLVVKKVRQRKQDGTLYLMAERIAWGPEGKDRFTVSHLYADIRCEYWGEPCYSQLDHNLTLVVLSSSTLFLLCTGQKISPDGKAKVQLQLVLHTGESTTFHFANESSALKDREAAKELLQQLLPKFKKKANKELEEKNRWANVLKGWVCYSVKFLMTEIAQIQVRIASLLICVFYQCY